MATPDAESTERLDDGVRSRLNRTIAEGVEAVFAAGEATGPGDVGERVVDGREVANTLSAGTYATLAYASEQVRDPPSRVGRFLREAAPPFLEGLLPDDDPVSKVDAIKTLETTGRRALLDRRWAEVDPTSTKRALVVFGGPPGWLYRSAVDNTLSWLETEFENADVRSGDAPRTYGAEVFVAVLAAGVDRPARFDAASTDDAVDR